ncbi:hypothetical protein [uncultured Deinococcus sp.]|uniref:hypothetical protein n=1 Tax=uncultured Deinococcus sp. TaxID=158789 RepID=UPI00258CCA04|nr:hypothetical protein [uncultured Deinococcus sp.]
MRDLRPASWAELIDTLQHDSWNPELRRFRSPYIFRGQGTPAPLTTSLQRLSAHPRDIERATSCAPFANTPPAPSAPRTSTGRG